MVMLHRSRSILAFNGILLIFTGVSFIIFAEEITIFMFPKIIINSEAIDVGVTLRYLMGSGIITIGIILYLARISVKSAAQRILLGSSLGFFIIFCTSLFIYISGKSNFPIAGLLLFFYLSLISFYVATRKFQE